MTTNYERYLAGEPLTDELAALRRGEAPELGPTLVGRTTSVVHEGTQDPERDLMRSEREALKELRQSPGWPVLQRLLDRATLVHKQSAIALSVDDPLARSGRIAQAWAYFNLYKRACAELLLLVDAEIKAMEEKQHGKDEAESA